LGGCTALGADGGFIAKNQIFKYIAATSAGKVKHGHTESPEMRCYAGFVAVCQHRCGSAADAECAVW
jgi:hypothetical protein